MKQSFKPFSYLNDLMVPPTNYIVSTVTWNASFIDWSGLVTTEDKSILNQCYVLSEVWRFSTWIKTFNMFYVKWCFQCVVIVN